MNLVKNMLILFLGCLMVSCGTKEMEQLPVYRSLNGLSGKKVAALTGCFVIGVHAENSDGYVATSDGGGESLWEGIKNGFQRNIMEEKRYLMILDGLKLMAFISLLAGLFGILLATLICWMRMCRYAVLRQLTAIYTSLMRGTPVLVLLLLFFIPVCVQGQRIVFTPQWVPQAQFAGYYVAFDKGLYKAAGLDVDIQHPSASYSALNRLFEGSSDMITQQLVQAMIEIDRGIPLVNILQTSQQNGLMVVSRTDSIRSLDDLRGKKVGVWKVGFGELAFMMDAEKEMGIQWIPFLQSVNLYVSGAVDATLGMSYNEYLQIKVSGHEDKPVMRFADTEYNYPEDGLYVSAEFYNRYPEQVKAFAQASKEGWKWVHEHPEEALDIVMKWAEKEKVYTNRIHQKWMLEEILRLQCAKGEDKPSFELDAKMLEDLNNLLLRHRRIRQPITLKQLKGEKP